MVKDSELLALLEEHGVDTSRKLVSTRIKKEYEQMNAFILEKEIYPGNIRIPTYKIYYEYVTHFKEPKLSKIEFFRTFSQHFKSTRDGIGRYYLLNSCFDLSEEAMQKALLYDKTK